MSGIFGFWNLDGRPADQTLLASMAATLAHRGPDGWSGWVGGSVAIGHRMFRTTPEAEYEVQPIVAGGGACVFAADLRLDNRDELIRALDVRDRAREGLSDAELLFRARAAYGVETPTHLLGAFAAVVWDARRSELTCMRDHFGEKPLYYCHAPGRLFAFASEIKALWALPDIPDEINDLEVARHLLIPVEDDLGATYYSAVRRLLPAHALVVSRTRVEERAYWELDASRMLALASDDEYSEAVRERFIDAVRCRLRANSPVASMLSGGLDSSSITCVAARLLDKADAGDPLRTVSAVYPDVLASDERAHIDAVIRACRVQPSFVRVDRLCPIAEIDDMNWHGDGANWGGNLYINRALCEAAAAGGARVVLDGFDGDTTLSHAHAWLVELALNHRWWRLFREVKAGAQVRGDSWPRVAYAWLRAYGVPPRVRFLAGGRRRERRRAIRAGQPPAWSRGLAPSFEKVVSAHAMPRRPPARTEREHHRQRMTSSTLLHMLSWVEAIGAGAGAEVRFPFFDVRLVELCVALPGEQKLRRGCSRFVMRQAMAGLVPDEVRWRRDKGDLSHGFYHALRTIRPGRAEVGALVPNERLARYLEPDMCVDTYRRFLTEAAPEDESGRPWRVSSLALWLTGSDRGSPPTPSESTVVGDHSDGWVHLEGHAYV